MFALSEAIKMTKLTDHTTAATTSVTTASLDMQGYDSVLFRTSFGTAAAANVIKVQHSSASTAGFEDLTGTSVSSGTSDEDVWVEVLKPQKRYVRVVAVRDTSSTLESIWADQHSARTVPCDNTVSGTITGEVHIAPSTGTA